MDRIDELTEIGPIGIVPDKSNRIVILTKEQRDWAVKEIERLREIIKCKDVLLFHFQHLKKADIDTAQALDRLQALKGERDGLDK